MCYSHSVYITAAQWGFTGVTNNLKLAICKYQTQSLWLYTWKNLKGGCCEHFIFLWPASWLHGCMLIISQNEVCIGLDWWCGNRILFPLYVEWETLTKDIWNISLNIRIYYKKNPTVKCTVNIIKVLFRRWNHSNAKRCLIKSFAKLKINSLII